MTLLFLKYVTQLDAQCFSNSANSGAHAFRAFSSSFTESIMPFRSRHWKKESRPSQHICLADLSGAMKPPSVEGWAGGGVSCLLVLLNQDMLLEVGGLERM